MTVLTTPTPLEAVVRDVIAIEAKTVDSQALSINAAINKMTTTIAGVWDLDTTRNEVPKTTVFVAHKNAGAESVQEGDDRKLVEPKDFNPGGKYRSILKLFIKYEKLGNNKFAHGTGWLIRPDVMITAGHNVYSWKSNAGRAIEIKAFAGYDGASNIDSPSVQFRKAKRVVTTSHWLSNRGSMAHDFALVVFDQPFTDVTPFQYIETPPKDKVELGVVGYPADKIDEQTGERGGKMYELFEVTEYNITEQKDTMLQHYIDSEGGNSGGPVLRGSDLCAIGIHVYGGDFNTASILGRYGNPVQDYLAAFDLPLANPDQINLVPVGNDHISQSDAATGTQAKEIVKLGDNVTTPVNNGANGTSSPEFWIFEGVSEIFDMTKDLATTLGPLVAGPIGSVITPIIVTALKQAQSESQFDLGTSLRRALLANTTLLIAEQKNAKEEGWFDSVTDVFADNLGFNLKPIGSPVINLPFGAVMDAIKVADNVANKLVNDVAGEVARALILRAQIPVLNMARSESSIDTGAPAASENEIAFLKNLGQAVRGPKEEGWLDDVGSFIQNTTSDVANVVSDGVKIVGDNVNSAANTVKEGVAKGVDGAVDAAKKATGFVGKVTETANRTVNQAVDQTVDLASNVPVGGQLFGNLIRDGTRTPLQILDMVNRIAHVAKTESAVNEPEGMFDELEGLIRKISQALILHTIVADQFLSAQMARPVAELKEEGFFDDVGDFFSNKKNIKVIGGTISSIGAIMPLVPVVGPILGLGMLGVGGVTTVVGLAVE